MQVTADIIKAIQQVIAAVILIGEIKFISIANDACTFNDLTKSNLFQVAQLLQLDCATLSECLLGIKSEVGRGEVMRQAFKDSQVVDNRDAVAKAIYSRLFTWLVSTCNSTLKEKNGAANLGVEVLSLGILDIFGFENFACNSLEQLCINLANETLQQTFNNFVFKMEQSEYAREGVQWTYIEHEDNELILDLFLKKPQGILSILDEESFFPKATDQTLLEHFRPLKDHPSNVFILPKTLVNGIFTINHFACPVIYTVAGFLDKNRDVLSKNVVDCFQSSKSDWFAVELFGAVKKMTASTTSKDPTESGKKTR